MMAPAQARDRLEDAVDALVKTPVPVREWSITHRRPGPSAPLKDILGFCSSLTSGDAVPAEMQPRLVEAVERYPDLAMQLLDKLPESPEVGERLYRLWQGAPAKAPWKDPLEHWLTLHTLHFRADLEKTARSATWPKGMEALEAFAQLSPEAARGLLLERQGNADLRVATAARVLLLDVEVRLGHDEAAEKLRAGLRALVEGRPSRTRPAAEKQSFGETPAATSRATALDTLLDRPWPGWERWYLERFADTPLSFTGGIVINGGDRGGLMRPVLAHPDEWIPRVVQLLDRPEARDNAAAVLLNYWRDHRDRRDIAVGLLPWLEQPHWSRLESGRIWAIHAAGTAKLAEAFPILLKLAADESEVRGAAAAALREYADERAAPALRLALERSTQSLERCSVVEALVRCHGVAAPVAAKWMAAWAVEVANPSRRRAFEAAWMHDLKLAPEVAQGFALVRWLRTGDAEKMGEVVTAAWSEVTALQSSNPRAARTLRAELLEVPLPATLDHLLEDVANGEADDVELRAAMEHSAALLQRRREPLLALLPQGGARGGFAAAVLGEDRLTLPILQGQDRSQQRALLACAAHGHVVLPLPEVSRLGESERDAVEAWLRAIDSREARRALLNLGPGVAGADADLDMFPVLRVEERQLQREMDRAGAPDQLFAVLSRGFGGISSWSQPDIVVRIRGSRAVLSAYPDRARRRDYTLTHSELAELLAFLESHGADDLPAVHQDWNHPFVEDYLHLTRGGGVRVVMRSPIFGAPEHRALLAEFLKLEKRTRGPLRYESLERLPGAAQVYVRAHLPAVGVWARGGDVRLEVVKGQSSFWVGDKPGAFTTRDYVKASDIGWYRLRAGGALGASAPAPYTRTPSKHDGLEGVLRSSDGRWELGYRRGKGDNQGTACWCLDTRSGQRRPVAIPAAHLIFPIAYVRPQHAFLLVRARANIFWSRPGDILDGSEMQDQSSEGPEHPEFWLYDPDNGECRVAHGEFRPWLASTLRPLQGLQGNEVWAALPDFESNATDVGAFDTRSFTFRRLQRYEGIAFDGSQMWVDQAPGVVYVVYAGDVLRLPLAGRRDGYDPITGIHTTGPVDAKK